MNVPAKLKSVALPVPELGPGTRSLEQPKMFGQSLPGASIPPNGHDAALPSPFVSIPFPFSFPLPLPLEVEPLKSI